MQTTTVGNQIESLVCAFLESNSLRCITRNYHCRLGEIDLVMLDETTQTLVFVEVRFRTAAIFGSATETVDWSKQRKLKRTVLHYLQKHANAKQRARIDVIGVCRQAEPDNLLSNAQAITASAPSHGEIRFGVSTHLFEEYKLRWTRNAVEG